VFLKPVEIGSIVEFKAVAAYASANSVQVRVSAEVIDPFTGDHATTNTFSYAFAIPRHTRVEIVPSTFEECMHYIAGLRAYKDVGRGPPTSSVVESPRVTLGMTAVPTSSKNKIRSQMLSSAQKVSWEDASTA
jgi:acyl-CoA hydrolase